MLHRVVSHKLTDVSMVLTAPILVIMIQQLPVRIGEFIRDCMAQGPRSLFLATAGT